MRHILTVLAALFLCASAQAQTVKALSYNSTNDTVVQTQRITFTKIGVATGTAASPSMTYASGTNNFGTFASTQLGIGPHLGFSVDGTRRFLIATNTIRAELPISFGTTTNAAETRTNLSLGATWLTNTNVTNFRSAIGLGATNDVEFNSIGQGGGFRMDFGAGTIYDTDTTNVVFSFASGTWYVPITFSTNTVAATTRTNLGAARAPIWAYKATNQTNSTTNLVSDAALTFTAAANTKYAVTLFLKMESGADSAKGKIIVSNAPTVIGHWTFYDPINGQSPPTGIMVTNEALFFLADSQEPASFMQNFVVAAGTNNAPITFQFARGSTNTNTVIVGAGSYIKAEVIE
jgi:hypothetical protein